jgi:DNA-binding transcriptional LysR family regulator
MKRGTLTIHASQTIASYWLPSTSCNFAAHPAIALSVTIDNTHNVAQAVLQGAPTLALSRAPSTSRHYRSMPSHPTRSSL